MGKQQRVVGREQQGSQGSLSALAISWKPDACLLGSRTRAPLQAHHWGTSRNGVNPSLSASRLLACQYSCLESVLCVAVACTLAVAVRVSQGTLGLHQHGTLLSARCACCTCYPAE